MAGAEAPSAALHVIADPDDCAQRTGAGEQRDVSATMSAVGTMLVIGASFVSCFGVNLQKWAHNHRSSLPVAQRRSIYRCWRWWLGMLAMIVGSLMDVAALPFVPLSRVAALGSSSLVANIIITPMFLKERISKHDVAGCAVAVAGTTTACMFGAVQEPQLDGDCLLQYLLEPLFLWYISGVAGFLVVLAFLMEGFRRRQRGAELAGLVGGTDQPAALECVWAHDNLSALRQVPDDRNFPYVTRCGPQFYPTVYAAFAGTAGAQSIMLAKASMVFVAQLLARKTPLRSLTLLLAFLPPTAFCLWGQIHFLNEALRIYCDAIFVLPIYQAFWVTAGIASGLIFYQEYRRVPRRHIELFCLGVATCLAGLFILSRRKTKGSRVAAAMLLPDKGFAAKDSDHESAGQASPSAAEPTSGRGEPNSGGSSAGRRSRSSVAAAAAVRTL
eukprot:TRINITY_DN669_c0_g1_i1.p1 TRINITY_DN669_c0_g1~~TRINITY_DN669_c0_g1_i1.p1  ORF type:complete len:443 (+),score=152.47 TRINITY_DN669_c0_g1_i1:77-1405(+)